MEKVNKTLSGAELTIFFSVANLKALKNISPFPKEAAMLKRDEAFAQIHGVIVLSIRYLQRVFRGNELAKKDFNGLLIISDKNGRILQSRWLADSSNDGSLEQIAAAITAQLAAKPKAVSSRQAAGQTSAGAFWTTIEGEKAIVALSMNLGQELSEALLMVSLSVTGFLPKQDVAKAIVTAIKEGLL